MKSFKIPKPTVKCSSPVTADLAPRTFRLKAANITTMHLLGVMAFLLSLLHWSRCIVNPNQESADMVIYLQKPSSLGPRTWLAGINCLDEFTRIYFQKRESLTRSPNLVITIAAGMSTPAAQIQEGFLKMMMEAVSEMPPQHLHYQLRIVSDSQVYRRISMNQRELVLADYYIIVVDSLSRLKNLMANYVSHMLSWNPGARFLVLYNNLNNRQQEEETARAVFGQMLEHFYVHSVALLYAKGDTSYSFMLMDYYNSTACRTLSVKHFAECQEGQVLSSDVEALQTELNHFLNSTTLNNCTFYMCASISAPFVEADCVLGLEMHTIGFIKTRLKFNVHQKCERESRGVEEPSGNWSGLLGRLNEKACDFVIGGFYPDNEVIANFWVSDTYLQDSYTWFIETADPRPAWMALYSIFKGLTWLTIILMLLITWLTWYVVMNCLPEPPGTGELSLTGLNNMGVTICAAVYEQPLCVSSRIFFFSMALYGLNITSTYTSKLVSVLTNPGFLHQIDNLGEVVEAGIPFGGYEECRDWFENKDDLWIFDQYNDSSAFEPTSLNLLYVQSGERVILSSRMYILQNPLADYVHAFTDNVFSSPIQMIVKPGFPFLYDFNRIIRYMRDYGLFAKINQDFVYNNTYLNRIAKMRPEFQETVIVLTMNHLQGAFSILSVGLGLSSFFFVAELFSYYCCLPWWAKHFPSSDPSETVIKSKKQKKSKRKGKRRKSSEDGYSAKEILLAWNEINVQKEDIRFTPVKRRIVHK